MGWERHNILTPKEPETLSLWRWIIAGLLSLLAGILFFVLHAKKYVLFLGEFNIWLVTLFPVVLWILLASLRGYLYSRALEEFEFLQKEILFAQSKWQLWGERSFVVLNSCVLLPDKITVAFLANQSKNLENQYGLVRRIDYLPQVKNQYHATTVLLNCISESLNVLPTAIPLHVTFITDAPPEMRRLLNVNFHSIWQASLPGRPQPSSVRVETQFPCYRLDVNLKNAEVRSDLVLVLQFNGQNSYSDGMAAFLLVSDDVARNYSLKGKCRLLRPMPLDKSCLTQDLTTFFTTQVCAKNAKAIVSDCQSIDSLNVQLYPMGHSYGAHWQVDNSVILEKYMGIPGPFSGWLCAGVASDMAQHYTDSYLAVSVQDEQSYICTVLPWSENEYDKPSVA
ncbi:MULTISPECIES: type VI secretion protein [Citrobacter freundii complex]|jgi:hypothetical protein|uniref:YfhO family protein n=1 Tax=Citrobacter gillenii TaxID=67828 RepID=A0ABD6M4P7_9ENTR|nr:MULTISPECIES: type VI secretion protein [Citrobacter freundii complex]NTZ51634.1 YfhO family protein [Citrobacter gillenii]QMG39714.1 type VI secretion protein [Citrobacter freundii]